MDATFDVEGKVFNYRIAGVWIEDGHVLLHRQASEGHWALPGGRAQMLEDSKSCLVREMKEELGVQVQAGELLWVTENFFTYRSKQYHELGFYYKVEAAEGVMHFREGPFFGPEGERLVYQWIPLEELEEVQLVPEFLRKSLKQLPAATEHVLVFDAVL